MIVLDCSAAVAIAQNTEDGKILRALIAPEEEIVAPSLFATEVANVAWKYVHAGIYDAAQARQLMENALALVDRFVPAEELIEEAFATAVLLDHSVYDITYLILTRRHAATLMTCDKRLQTACATARISCIEEVSF